MAVEYLLVTAAWSGQCQVHLADGVPNVPGELRLPDDLAAFYRNCGGIDLFLGRDYGISIVSPKLFQPSNPVIVGEQVPDDISSTWYIIAETPNGDHLSIDLSPERNGRCYDSFYEIHAVVGLSPIIATNFTSLLENLLNAAGGYWYWLEPDFGDLGDAYE